MHKQIMQYSAQQWRYEWVDVGMMKQRWIDKIHEYYELVMNYVAKCINIVLHVSILCYRSMWYKYVEIRMNIWLWKYKGALIINIFVFIYKIVT